MAIDDLLYQSDPAQRRARAAAAPKPSGIDAGMQDRLAKMRAADTAAAERSLAQQRIQPAPAAAAAPKPAAAPAAAKPAAAAPVGKVAKIARAAKAVGTVGALAATGIDTATTEQEDYYKRFGLEPKNDGTITGDLLPNVGVRALGAASDLGNALTFGAAGKLFRDKQQEQPIASLTERPAAAPGGLPNKPQAQPVVGAAAASPQVFRQGNTFTDQPGPGREPFTPAQAGVSVLGGAEDMKRIEAFLAERDAERNEQQARRSQADQADFARVAQFREREGLEAAARSARIEANSFRNSDLPPRYRSALQLRASELAAQAAGVEGRAPAGARTPEQEVALAGQKRQNKMQGDLAEQQSIAAGLQNQQAQRAATVMQQIDQLNEQTPSGQRRALIDRALVGQGKDPDAGRFEAIENIAGIDQFGAPIKVRSLFDTRSGQVVGGGQQAPAMGSSAPKLEDFLKAAKADPRNKGVSDEELKAYFNSTYGKS